MDNVTTEFLSANPQYRVAARSHMGGRSEQQDRAYVCCDEHNIFALVCDGMGGAADGRAASDAAVATMRQAYKEYIADGTGESPASFLYRAMVDADKAVFRKGKNRGGGTTMVAALIRDDFLYWISVGDSRLYILRAGELLQVTRDHNYFLRLNELKAQGEISESRYQKEAERGEALISYLGLGEITLFDLTQAGFQMYCGDKLFLATDGLFKVLSLDLMKAITEFQNDISVRADSFMKQVLKERELQALDNTTFIMIDAL